ncbi:hypothetical protein BFP70_10550 [Thioclava sp. SK-1]|nr:hypothetical protein BFP70_10550 [Thioclava sp. SK-1]
MGLCARLGIVIALGLCATPQTSLASPITAGTVIRNIAQTTYFNTALGLMETIQSNPVEARVAAVPAVDISGQTRLNISRGTRDHYYYRIRNTGNVSLQIAPQIQLRGAVALVRDARLVRDVNGNGLVDRDDLAVDPSVQLTLKQGQTIDLIYSFRIAQGAQPGDQFQAELILHADYNAVAQQVTGDAMGQATIVLAALELTKTQSIVPGDTRDTLRYDLRLRNMSDMAVAAYDIIDAAPVRINGTQTAGIVLRDSVPLNTVFAEIVQNGGLTPLYHRRGDPKHSYLTKRPNDSRTIDAVAFFHPGAYASGRANYVAFSVTLDHTLGEIEVENTAQTYGTGGSGAFDLPSNTVRYIANRDAPGQLHIIDPHTETGVDHATLGSDIALRVTSGACNISTAVDTLMVMLRSQLTGDIEPILARETGANTGVFVTPPLPIADMAQAVHADGVIAAIQGDHLHAQTQCGGTALQATVQVEPGNFVFDAITNAPVADVTLVLIDANTGRETARTRSDARGFFAFGTLPPGRYRFDIADTSDWQFPSIRAEFRGFGRSTTQAAFGAIFNHGGGVISVSDLPLDPFYGAPIGLRKQADRDRVTQGDFVTYTLTLTNNMQQALVGAQVFDRPDRGMRIVPGSSSLNGTALADPMADADGDMVFDLGNLLPLGSYKLSYAMAVTAVAHEGQLENTAILTGRQAGSGILHQSALARAVVRLDNSGGVFARQGTVLGTVFMDCNANGRQDGTSEPGIPGIRIVTQEGLFVVTDINGKYSLPGLRPVTHAFGVQSATLPANTQIRVTRSNDLGRGGTRLVPLRRGEMRVENFAVLACTPDTLAEVTARRDHFTQDMKRPGLHATDLPIEATRATTLSARSEAGVATTTHLTPSLLQAQNEDPQHGVLRPTLTEKTRTPRRPLDAMIKEFDETAVFLDLEDGQILKRRTQNIRVKARADLTLDLIVNGRPLGSQRVGEHSRWGEKNVQAIEFIAVTLRAGDNHLVLVGRDGFGIERLRHDVRVTAPGDATRIDIIAPDTASANPVNKIPVVVRLLDARGLPVPASATVTLSAGKALWDVEDIRPGAPGVQAYIDNGEATFNLIAPQIAGPDTLIIRAGFDTAQAAITFTPDLNEHILIGVIEGAIALNKNTAGALLRDGRLNPFEDTTTGLRGELYFKGAIRGESLLTLRYSSDRDTEDRLFRDIQADEYYPIYGDSSERGYDAQSSSNLYVKVEQGRSYMLYGDIAIEPEASAFKLGGQRRVATGAKAHWENDRVSVTVFGAYTAQNQQVVEFPGRGVSGPYNLTLAGYVEGSERVEVLVRDEDGGDILTATSLRRGTDYILDFFRNTITFDDPLRQYDLQGNPISVRVTYEVEHDGAARYWLYGSEVNYALNERTTLGARGVHSDAPKGNPAREQLQSAYLRHETLRGGIWEAELARSVDFAGRRDQAGRLSYDLRTQDQQLRFEAIHTGNNFVAGGGLARAGTTQMRLSYGVALDDKNDLELVAQYLKDRSADRDSLEIEALYARRFNDRLRGEIGLELASRSQDGRRGEDGAVIIGADWSPTSRPDVAIRARLRLPVIGQNRDHAELVLGSYREPAPGWRSYNEVELTFDRRMLLSRARWGMEYQLNSWLSGTTEISEAPDDLEETLHQGVDTQWQINDATTLNLGLEHSRKAKTGGEELTSITLGATWENHAGTRVGDADFDTTIEPDGTTFYASLGLAAQVTPDWALLGRTRVAVDKRSKPHHQRIRTRLGIAYRPVSDPRLDVLGWYEHRLEQRHGRNETHLWSVDAHYEPTENLRLNGKYAGQHQSICVGPTYAQTTTQLLQAGLNVEFFDDRLQFGMNAARLWDNDGAGTTGIGAELGFSPTEGALIAVGFNAVSDEVAGQSDLYQDGAYLRVNLLLDDSLWDRLNGLLAK